MTKTHCPTCDSPTNFGSMCDPCAQRIQRTRHLLRAVGQEKTPLGRALGLAK